MANPSTVIAGENAGIKVNISPSLRPVYDELKRLGLQGQHWARVTTKEIDSLTSGHMKENVFVPPSAVGNFRLEFTLLLPGCKAKAIKKADGSYYIYHMELDAGYADLVQKGRKPALYSVRKKGTVWVTRQKTNGEIDNQPERTVVVMDSYDQPHVAAKIAAHHASGAPIGGGSYITERRGFDMQYHYDKTKIGGLRQISTALNPLSDRELKENASVLADTMQKAVKTSGVAWISEYGGSGVLTVAMHILKERKVDFNGSEHHIFFSQPTTNLSQAEALGRDLGMSFSRQTHNAHKLNPDVLVGGLNFGGDILGSFHRYKVDADYTAINMGVDISKQVGTSWKAISTLSASTTAVTAIVGVGGTAFALPATIAIASTVAGVGNELFKAWLPNQYIALKSKL